MKIKFNHVMPREYSGRDIENHVKRTLVRNVFDEWISMMERDNTEYLLGRPKFIIQERSPLNPYYSGEILITCEVEIYTFDDNKMEGDFFEYSGTHY